MAFGKKEEKNATKMMKMPLSGSTSKQHIVMKNEVIRVEIFVNESLTIWELKIDDSEAFPTLLQNIDFSFWTKKCALWDGSGLKKPYIYYYAGDK